MRVWKPLIAGSLVLAGGRFAALSLTRGQEPTPTTGSGNPVAESRIEPAKAEQPRPDLSKLPPLQQQMFLSVQRGADWLRRANRADGRFVYGFVPSLKVPLEGDHYLRQVGAAFCMA